MTSDDTQLIHDWNRPEDVPGPLSGPIQLNDETLRDGLQSPSVRTPSMEQKLRALHLMAELGIHTADIGLPGAGPHVVESVRRLAREIVDQKLPIAANCAARTLERDIDPIIEVAQETGLEIECCCFLGSSPIRQFAENWQIDKLLELTERAISYAVAHGLSVMYVTEDTTRAAPEDLRRLYTVAVEAGARRVCVADTVGHATPEGATNVVAFVREVVGDEIGIDWHGHRDRAFSIANSIAAARAGASRLHATALGIGERVGNTPMDLLLVNLSLMGWIERDLTALPEYCELFAEATGVRCPDNYPVIGRDAFRTGTGVHAAAIIKAHKKGDDWLADRIYSGVPAGLIGRHQEIEIGPMSGQSNVVFWLESRGAEATPELVEEIFGRAKASKRVLEEDEIAAICARRGVVL